MRGFFLIFSAFCLLFFSPALAINQVIVKFHPHVISMLEGARVVAKPASVQTLNQKLGAEKYEQLFKKILEIRPDMKELEDEYVVTFTATADAEKIAREYRKNPNVQYASPNSVLRAFTVTPNDPYFSQQYALTNMKVSQAWDKTTGTSETLIAVLDTGVNYLHEDLQSKVALSDGYDFVNNDANPMDDHSSFHGSCVSGVIAAATNNAKGVAGVDWNARILPIKVLNAAGEGTMANILQGIEWARAKHAKVINMSFGQYSSDTSLQDHCQNAYNDGIVLVAAAGNGGVSWATYPAYYSTVLAVAAVDSSDKRSVWSGIDPVTLQTQASNYGDWVDVAAPGTAILSTYKGTDQYASVNGTSFSSPYIAGVAGLIRAAFPSLTNRQIMDRITSEADNIDSLNPGYAGKLGSGRANAYRSIAGVIARLTSPASAAYLKGSVDINGSAGGWDFTNYILEALDSSGNVAATIETSTTSVEGAQLGTWNTGSLLGQYTVRLRVITNSSGTSTCESVVYLDNSTPEASLTSVADGSTLEGNVLLLGSAADQYLDHYSLSYQSISNPSINGTIKTGYVSVAAGVLGTWETSGLEGQYRLTLVAYNKAGTSNQANVLVNVKTTPSDKKATSFTAYAAPNPVTGEASFRYSLNGNFNTKIYIFNIAGDLIWQKSYSAGENGAKAGENSPTWNLCNLFNNTKVVNGVYLFMIVSDQKSIAKGKLIILN